MGAVNIDPDSPSSVLGDSGLQSQTLEDIASAVNYHRWLRDLARPFLGADPLEFGSGLGDYAEAFVAEGVPRFTVTDADPSRIEALGRRFAHEDRVDVRALDVTDVGLGDHSSVVAFNVLEHIPDDAAALRGAAGLVRNGGAVIMLVPAFPFAMSDFDRRVGHVRRYRRADLRAAFEAAGLEVEKLHYVNAPGLPAWFVGMRLLRGTPTDGPMLRFWDAAVVPMARRVESRLRAPFGQSLFAVGRVRAECSGD